MEAMEMERKNTLQYMLMVYLGEKRWAKVPQAGGSFGGERSNAELPLGDVAALAAR